MEWLNESPLCDHSASPQPFIVPPTWAKTRYHGAIKEVWKRAAKELSLAEYIFVIGYSFPGSDAFFHHLYALGSVSDTPLRKFWVFNPDTTEVQQRFEGLLGTGAKTVFEYRPVKFKEAVEEVWGLFR